MDVPEISPHASDGTRPVVFEEDTLDLSAEDPDGSPQRLAPEGLAFSEGAPLSEDNNIIITLYILYDRIFVLFKLTSR